MATHMQNAGVRPGVSRDQLGGWSQFPITVPDWRWQLIASRYQLPGSMARETAQLHFGEGRWND